MKELIFKIKNKLKDLIPFKRVNSHAHWDCLLRIFFTLVIILIIFSFYLLYKIRNQQIFQITPIPAETSRLIDEKLLDKVTESFNTKSIKTKEIKNNPKTYKDPSIN